MSSFLASQLPPPSEIVELPEDELGPRLLKLIVDHQQGHLLNRHNLGVPGTWQELGPGSTSAEFLQAIVEAWEWLAANRLVAVRSGESGQ